MTARRSQFRTFAAMYRWWRQHLSIGGQALCVAILFCLPGVVTLEAPQVALLSALLTLLVVTAAAGWWFRPRLTVEVQMPASTMCGEPFDVLVRITNRRRCHAFDLCIDLANRPGSWQIIGTPPVVESLSGSEAVTVKICVRPARRGVFACPRVCVTSAFPLNLFRFARDYPLAGEIVVYPAYDPLRSIELLGCTAEPEERCETGGHAGDSWDYLGNREYQPGIAVRRWDYCSWARLGRPVVREFHDAHQFDAAVFVDTFFRAAEATVAGPEDRHGTAPADEPESPELEAVISLAAGLSHALAAAGHRVVLLTLGPVVIEGPGSSLTDQHLAILEMLATARAADPRRRPELFSALDGVVMWGSAAFLVTGAVRSTSGNVHERELSTLLEDAGCRVRHLAADALVAQAGSTEVLLT